MRTFAVVVAVAIGTLCLSAGASAAPVATSDPQYQAYGAVFPDPLAVCQQNCDPQLARSHERHPVHPVAGVRGRARVHEPERGLEALHGGAAARRQEGRRAAAPTAGDEMWPGNNLVEARVGPEAGVPVGRPRDVNQEQGTGKPKSDLIVVRVTDENVPDKDKKRYALSLSIHGIERAGAEGGIRAMEEIVTAVAEGRGDERDPARGGPRRTRRRWQRGARQHDHLLHVPEPGRMAPRLDRRRREGPASSSSATTATASTRTATGPTSATRSAATAAGRSPRRARSRLLPRRAAEGRPVRRR